MSQTQINNPLRIIITPGEPAGIGPDISIDLLAMDWPAQLIVVADPELMQQRAKQLNKPLEILEWRPNQPIPHAHRNLIVPVKLSEPVIAGQLNPNNAAYTVKSLSTAAQLCMDKIGAALVTGPVHKATINAAHIPFTGHTEFFAQHCHRSLTVMLFVVGDLKVALATTHVPLSKVHSTLTQTKLRETIEILNQSLQSEFKIKQPRILVCGLNPHAGENGYLGMEEIEIITPVLQALRAEGTNVQGPYPADTIFTPKYLNQADVILAMYHDQALPLVKYLGFGNAVNVTLGLPFIRTSVDHGTAIDLAGSGSANADSMKQALRLAIELARGETKTA